MMLSADWLFVLAAAIAVTGISIAFRRAIDSILEKKDSGDLDLGPIQTKFILSVAIIESIPIFLVVLAFVNMTSMTNPFNITTPVVILVLIWLLGISSVRVKAKDAVSGVEDRDFRNRINTFMFIAWALVSSFPILGLIGLTVMNG